MALWYMDVNGSSAGFGTLSQTAPNNTITATLNALGNVNTTAIAFSAATAHVLSFGSPSTNANTTPGTLSTNFNGVQFGFNGLVFQNLTGTQLINTAGATTGTLTLVGTNPFIEVTADGVLDINRSMVGTVNWEKRGATILRLRGNNTFSGGMTIAEGTVEVGSATALGNTAGTVTMRGGKLSSSTVTAYSFANPLALNGTVVLGDNTNTGALTFSGTTSISGVTALTVLSEITLSGVVSGANAWSKAGSAVLKLTAANTFSQGLTISAGTVQIGNASALGTGTVTMTGGKLSSSSTTGYSLANALTLNGTMTLGDAANTGVNTFSGILTVSGPSTLTAATAIGFYGSFQGSGSLSLGGNNYFFTGASNNTYSGALTLTSGGILLADFNSGTPNQLGTGTISVSNPANIQMCGNTTHTFTNTISGGVDAVIYARNTSPNGLVFNGTMSGYLGSLRIYADSVEGANPVQKLTLTNAAQYAFSSFLYQSGSGLTTLSQTLSYTGTSVVSTSKSFNIYASALTSGGTAIYSNDSTNGSLITNTGTFAFETAGTYTLRLAAITGPISLTNTVSDSSGTLNLSKTGTNAVTLSGANNFKGTVAVSAGTLNANSATALGATSGGAISVTSGATLSLGAAPTYTSRSLTIGGTGTASTVGALVIANAGTNQFQSILLGSPTNYIRATNSGIINAPFTTNNNSVIFGASTGSDFIPFASLSNVFSGTGSVTYGSHSGDTGIVRADVRHTYTGNTTLAYGTTYIVSSLEVPGTGGPLGNKSLTAANTLLMTGGTLSYLGGNVDYSGRFSTAGSQQWKIDAAGETVTFATALVGASSLSLSDTSTNGSLTLSSSASTFSSGVNLVGGTLNLGAPELKTGLGVPISGPLGLTGDITFTGGTLQYSSANQNDYSFRFSTNAGQQWKIDTNGQDVTFSSALTSIGGSLVKSALGTLTLAVANAYNSGTTLSAGTLKCSNAASLGTGGLAQANNTALQVTATGGKLTIQGAHTQTGTGSRIIRIGA